MDRGDAEHASGPFRKPPAADRREVIVEILDGTETDQPQVRLAAGPGYAGRGYAGPGYRRQADDAEVRREAGQVVEGPVAPGRRELGGTRTGSSRAVNVVRGSRVQITSRAPICRPSRQDSTKPGPDRCTRVTGADTRQSAPALAARRNNAFGRFFEPPATSTGENHRATVNPPTAPIGSEGGPNPLAAHAYRSANLPASPEARAANPPGVRSARSAAASSPRDLQSASSDGSGSGARYRRPSPADRGDHGPSAAPSPAPPGRR